MPRRKQETPDEPSKAKGNDGLMSISIETTSGTISRTYRIAGYLGNTLPWQRSAKGMDDMLIPALLRAFGGQVTPE